MKEIRLNNNNFTLVDDEDFYFLNHWKWTNSDQGYVTRTEGKIINGKQKRFSIRMHRLILQANFILCFSDNEKIVDHINGNRIDNRKENLRICSIQQNSMNRIKRSDISKNFKGVFWRERDKNWKAAITVNRKYKQIGSYSTEKEAALAYNEAALKYFGEFAKLNIIT